MNPLIGMLRNAALNEERNLHSISRMGGLLENSPFALMLRAANEIERLEALLAAVSLLSTRRSDV